MEKKAAVKTKKAAETKSVAKPKAEAKPKAAVPTKVVKAPAPKVVEKKEAPAAKAAPTKKTSTKAAGDGLKVPAQFHYGTGKRKTAIAKVWIFKGKGTILINDVPAADYVKSEILTSELQKPLQKLNLLGQYDCKITCLGGGISGQVGAIQLGIARALLQVSADYRKPLKESGFLTRDSRIKERKKYGRKRARKGYQFRKR